MTNDLNAYGTSSLGLTADSRTLVTVQAEKSAQLWVVAPGEDLSKAKQITSGKYDGDSLAWTGDGRILTPRHQASNQMCGASTATVRQTSR